MAKPKTDEKKRRASAGTVHLPEIISDTVSMIKRIENNPDYDQSERTRRLRALAESVKNKLHEDGRKKDENKISEATYRRYLTDVRRAISSENWHHHGLDKKLDVLARRYPQHAEKILSIRHDHVEDTRNAHKELLKELIDDSAAYEDLSGVIINHEILRHLAMDSAKKAKLAQAQAEALALKKNSTIDVDYNWLMNTTRSLLKPDADKQISFSRLALGIAFATGRRSIELLYQGKFEKAGKYELNFSGTAKKRGGADYSHSFRIYTIVPADDVLHAINLLRNQPEIKALDDFSELSEVDRNIAINRRVSKTLNTTAKRVWMDENRVFKDARPVWARIVFEEHFSNDKRWAKTDEDVFWHEQLGHEDIETQKAYKQFKIVRNAIEGAGDDRLSAVKELLKNPDITARKALVKITEWAIEKLAEDPEYAINQGRIIKEVGSGRTVINDWLKLSADALSKPAIAPAEKATGAPTQEKENNKQPEAAPKTEPKTAAKPRIKAVPITDDIWEVEIKIGDDVYSYGIPEADNKADAMKQAWEQYQAEK